MRGDQEGRGVIFSGKGEKISGIRRSMRRDTCEGGVFCRRRSRIEVMVVSCIHVYR